MNAVEIEQAITDLAERPFDADDVPFAFCEAFGNKGATLKNIRAGASNKSDLGGVLQVNHIHILVGGRSTPCATSPPPKSNATRSVSPRRRRRGVRGQDLTTAKTVGCAYAAFPDHFGFVLPLAGITIVRQIRENAFDARASRLNRRYLTLLTDNPDWGTAERRHDLNHFMARLIFCFVAEDTDIFNDDGLFTATVPQMSDRENTHEIIGETFRAIKTAIPKCAAAALPRWADVCLQVNGGIFAGNNDVPTFSRIAQKYLLHIGQLDWKKINPETFGSKIEAVADDMELTARDIRCTSVPNNLKVLNPLFLDELHAALDEAADNPRKRLNLRKRMSNIRVFNPACGSGNFLAIAHKAMRATETQINTFPNR